MNKNIFIKSMLRQRLRTILLVGLIGLAAFAFVLRTVEFLVVRGQIMEAAQFYRTTGFINHPALFGDVTEGIELIADSPHISFSDSRRSAQGFLQGILNADISGLHHQTPAFRTARYILPTITEAYFYATLLELVPVGGGGTRLVMHVDEVLAGHPEYIVQGQTLYLHFHRVPAMNLEAIDAMEIGGRYFMHGGYVRRFFHQAGGPQALPGGLGPIVPLEGRADDWLHMWPLNNLSDDFMEHVWFVPVAEGESVDFTQPELSHLPAEIAMLNLNHANILLQTTRDLTSAPQLSELLLLHEGRLIDYNDYAEANHVAVIDITFASTRGLEIGDTITVNVPRHQSLSGSINMPGLMVPLVNVDMNYPERLENPHQIELEIVGITMFDQLTTISTQSLFVFIPDSVLPDDLIIHFYQRVVQDGEWVVLPPVPFGAEHVPDAWYSFVMADSRYYGAFTDQFWMTFIHMNMDLIIHHMDSTNFWLSANPILLSITFNAVLFWVVLLVVLGLVSFLYLRQRHRDMAIMRALGLPIRKVAMRLLISVVLFALPGILIGGGLAWNFAISEAEATLATFEEAYDETIIPTEQELLWRQFFGDRPMPDLLGEARELEFSVGLSIVWLAVLFAAIFVIVILMIVLGGLRLLGRPVLELLQGNTTKAKSSKTQAGNAVIEDDLSTTTIAVANLPPFKAPQRPVTTRSAARGNALYWIRLHLTRAPVKTGLGVAIGLFFLFALGWLQASINTTSAEMEHILNTTVVQMEFSANPAAVPTRHVDDVLTQWMRRALYDMGDAVEYYLEGAFLRSFAIAPEYNTMPATWFWRIDVARFLGGNLPLSDAESSRPFGVFVDHNRNRMDFMLGVTCLDTFLQRHIPTAASQMVIDVIEDFELEGEFALDVRDAPRISHIYFAEGFDTSVFEPSDDWGIGRVHGTAVIPVILSQTTAWLRGLTLGDPVLVAYNTSPNPSGVNPWPYVHGVVVGIHNEQIHINNMRQAMLIPHWAFTELTRGWGNYVYVSLGLNPSHNRDLGTIRNDLMMRVNTLDAIGSIFDPPAAHMLFHDDELRNSLASLEQILTLLELLFPIAVGLAVVIGAGLAILLVQQGTKNAAILRTTGTSRNKTAALLFSEQIIICLIGLAIGLAALLFISITLPQMLLLAVLYLGGVAVGAVVGAAVVTSKAPLDLLQVRE